MQPPGSAHQHAISDHRFLKTVLVVISALAIAGVLVARAIAVAFGSGGNESSDATAAVGAIVGLTLLLLAWIWREGWHTRAVLPVLGALLVAGSAFLAWLTPPNSPAYGPWRMGTDIPVAILWSKSDALWADFNGSIDWDTVVLAEILFVIAFLGIAARLVRRTPHTLRLWIGVLGVFVVGLYVVSAASNGLQHLGPGAYVAIDGTFFMLLAPKPQRAGLE